LAVSKATRREATILRARVYDTNIAKHKHNTPECDITIALMLKEPHTFVEVVERRVGPLAGSASSGGRSGRGGRSGSGVGDVGCGSDHSDVFATLPRLLHKGEPGTRGSALALYLPDSEQRVATQKEKLLCEGPSGKDNSRTKRTLSLGFSFDRCPQYSSKSFFCSGVRNRKKRERKRGEKFVPSRRECLPS
jgi:hypothetical protein